MINIHIFKLFAVACICFNSVSSLAMSEFAADPYAADAINSKVFKAYWTEVGKDLGYPKFENGSIQMFDPSWIELHHSAWGSFGSKKRLYLSGAIALNILNSRKNIQPADEFKSLTMGMLQCMNATYVMWSTFIKNNLNVDGSIKDSLESCNMSRVINYDK